MNLCTHDSEIHFIDMVLNVDGVDKNNEIQVLKTKGGGSGSDRMLMRFFGTMGIGCLPVKYLVIGRRRMKLVTYRRRTTLKYKLMLIELTASYPGYKSKHYETVLYSLLHLYIAFKRT